MRVQTGPSRSMPGTPVGVPAGSRGVERSETPGCVTHAKSPGREAHVDPAPAVRDRVARSARRFVFALRSRRYRFAQPPATRLHPSGMRVQTGPSRSMPGTPVGVPAGSRGVERSETPGRVTHSRTHARDVERKQPHARPRLAFAFGFRRCRFAQPPATRGHPSGMRVQTGPSRSMPGTPVGVPAGSRGVERSETPGCVAHSRAHVRGVSSAARPPDA